MSVRDFIDKGVIVGELESFATGSCFFRKGDKTNYLYLLTEGSVAVIDSTTKMDEQVVAPPDFLLGITDLLNAAYSFTIFTLAPSKLIKIKKEALTLAAQHNPMLRLYLLKMMSWEANLTNKPFE